MPSPLWLVNRFVDFVFVLDMGFSFFMAYRLPVKMGGGYEKRLSKIRHNYLQSWFGRLPTFPHNSSTMPHFPSSPTLLVPSQ